MGRESKSMASENAGESRQYMRTGRVKRFGFVILLTALATVLMFAGQTIGQMLGERPDLARWAVVVTALMLALAWERATRPREEGKAEDAHGKGK